jgi:hypothetical protein
MPSIGPLTFRVGVEVPASSGNITLWSDIGKDRIPAISGGVSVDSAGAKCIAEFLTRQQDAVEVEFVMVTARALLAFPGGSQWKCQTTVSGPRILPWANSHREEKQLKRINLQSSGTETIVLDAIRYKTSGYPNWSPWHSGQALVIVSTT